MREPKRPDLQRTQDIRFYQGFLNMLLLRRLVPLKITEGPKLCELHLSVFILLKVDTENFKVCFCTHFQITTTNHLYVSINNIVL